SNSQRGSSHASHSCSVIAIVSLSLARTEESSGCPNVPLVRANNIVLGLSEECTSLQFASWFVHIGALRGRNRRQGNGPVQEADGRRGCFPVSLRRLLPVAKPASARRGRPPAADDVRSTRSKWARDKPLCRADRRLVQHRRLFDLGAGLAHRRVGIVSPALRGAPATGAAAPRSDHYFGHHG